MKKFIFREMPLAVSVLGLIILLGMLTNGCKVKKLTIDDPSGISTAKWILRLEIVPEVVDINTDGTGRAKLRAHLTDWAGSNLAGKTIYFEPVTTVITFDATGELSTLTRKSDTTLRCNLDCATNCTVVKSTSESSGTLQAVHAAECQGYVDLTSLGRIIYRYVKTDTAGMAITNFFAYPEYKARQKLASALSAYALDCTLSTVNIQTGSKTSIEYTEVDTDGDGTNDACEIVETTEVTEATLNSYSLLYSTSLQLPIRASWIETNNTEEAYDINYIKLVFPPWDNP